MRLLIGLPRAGRPIKFITGDILETIPDQAPAKIALLYLDTDYYDTTLHEMTHLYPRLSVGGVAISDDCGLCIGAARAVAEYCHRTARKPFLIPMSEAGSVWLKTS